MLHQGLWGLRVTQLYQFRIGSYFSAGRQVDYFFPLVGFRYADVLHEIPEYCLKCKTEVSGTSYFFGLMGSLAAMRVRNQLIKDCFLFLIFPLALRTISRKW